MPVLDRYYVAWTVNLVALGAFLLSRSLVLGAVTAATFIYANYLVRCPQCKQRLQLNRRKWIQPVSGKICLRCGRDLSKR